MGAGLVFTPTAFPSTARRTPATIRRYNTKKRQPHDDQEWKIHMVRVLAVVAISSTALAAAKVGRTSYTNVRFGYRIHYQPTLFRAQPEADNGDGREFRAIKGHASVTVWGEWVSADPWTTAKSEADSTLSECKNGKATYRLNEHALQVISCTLPNGDVLYLKVVQYKGTVVQLRAVYPQSEKATWDSVTAAMAQSLRALGPAY